MGRKKYTTAFKQQVVRHYLDSGDGAKTTARLFGVDHGAVRRWTEHWKVSGEAGFLISTKHYSAEFKESVILWMKENSSSSRKAAAKFQVAAACTVSKWERLYREGGIMALHNKRRGRPVASGKKNRSDKVVATTYPEFRNIEEELEYLRAENAYLKKLQALIREKQKIKHS
jgi:transposase